MRRKLLTYTLLAVAGGAVLFGCRRDRFGHDDPNAVEPTLTVNEARDFFEYQFSETMPYLTKLPQDRPTGMMPGDFTPLWDKARIGANREMDGADVPIDPKFIFVAVFNQVTPQGDTVRRTVDVIQKLVVKKWRNTEEYEAFCYIASIVPTPEYYAKHKNVGREFRYGGDKGEFSGFVIYRTLAGKLVGIDNYERGRRTRHDYFPRITGENRDSVQQIALQTTGAMTLQAGTPAMFGIGTEEDPWCADEITVCPEKPSGYCPTCGSYGGCSCWWPDNWGDHNGGDQGGNPNPDYNDGDNQGNTGGGGGNGSNPNTGNTPSVATLFNAQGFTESQKAEINSYLSRLSELGISNKVLTKLMEKGKITLKSGTEPGHEQSLGVYNKSENSITLNMESFEINGIRNALIEETFHAYQFSFYDKPNQRCMEFEAKVYGTVIINMFERNHGIGYTYLSPMAPNVDRDTHNSFGRDVKSMSGDFTHGISNGDMNTLYQRYGDHCTQYPAGDPNWEFKAIQNAQQ